MFRHAFLSLSSAVADAPKAAVDLLATAATAAAAATAAPAITAAAAVTDGARS